MKKGALVFSSVIAIVLSVILIAGSTLSLITSETSINISMVSGGIDLKAEMNGFEYYSMGEKQPTGKFENGGTGIILPDGTLSFENISAGDRVEFDVELKNDSDISIVYNTRLSLVGQTSNELFKKLKVSVTRGDDAALTAYSSGGNALNTSWTRLEKGDASFVHIALELDKDADDGAQDLTAKVKCSVSAVQANGDDWGVAMVNGDSFLKIDEAVKAAKDGDVVEILRSDEGGQVDFYGSIEVDKEITIQSAEPVRCEFKDLLFKVVDGGALTLRGLKLTGDSRIDVSAANSVLVDNCDIELAPSKLFDELNRVTLDRGAFIVANGNEQSGLVLNMTNNKFTLADGADENTAAVYLETALADGSIISGNVFGAEGRGFKGSAIDIKSVKAGATVRVESNLFYCAKAVSFAQKFSANPFAARLYANEIFYAGEDKISLAEVKGGVAVDLTDYGSKINGVAATIADLDGAGNVLFCGVNVEYTGGRIVRGTVKVYDESLSANDFDNFKTLYVSPSAYPGDVTLIKP